VVCRLDISDEFKQVISTLKGHDDKVGAWRPAGQTANTICGIHHVGPASWNHKAASQAHSRWLKLESHKPDTHRSVVSWVYAIPASCSKVAAC